MSELFKQVDVTNAGKNKMPASDDKLLRRWVHVFVSAMQDLEVGDSRFFHVGGIKHVLSRESNVCADFTMTWTLKRHGRKLSFSEILFLKCVVIFSSNIMGIKFKRMFMPIGNELMFSTSSEHEDIQYTSQQTKNS